MDNELELQRASAGSGKTYTLAKKYLWYYLTLTPEEPGAKPRLRTYAELADSARHILAVTFTNKATNEMQMRIVARLYDLGYRQPREVTRPDGSVKLVLPDYLEEFASTLGVDMGDVARTARQGLGLLLENYSDFKVSTIDSFFQLVLRTFAYESELNDGYQVELDNQYLSQVGVDATLEEIDNEQPRGELRFWVGELMRRREKGWNIFDRKIGGASAGAYSAFVGSVGKLENEEFKKVREDVEGYLKKKPDLRALYLDLNERYLKPGEDAFLALRDAARNFYRALPDGWQQKPSGNKRNLNYLVLAARNIAQTDRMPDDGPAAFKLDNLLPDKIAGADLQKVIDADPAASAAFEELYPVMLAASQDWQEIWADQAAANWRLYADNFPYLALMETVMRKRGEFLNESNAIELGETASILNKIIGDSDTPFVYERLGTRLNHFLIDEFQDTSELQWANMGPLLRESIGRGNGNLIIGDAKQSIYRFRNADPSLITDVIPREFAGRVQLLGDRESENTNWRSALHVVQFNNSFFEFLASRTGFSSLYSNVVQTPKRSEDESGRKVLREEGYVEIDITVGAAAASGNDDGGDAGQIAALVAKLMDRGYRQRDIAVLVNTNSQGAGVIAEFNDWNSRPGNEGAQIRFVSEQSLKVASSPAVMLVVEVLESIARGLNMKINEGEDARKKGVANWNDIKGEFRFFAMTAAGGEKPTEQLLEEFIALKPGSDALVEMLERLPALSLPSIVEGVAAEFIPAEKRTSEAIYIAAFQDLVLEYCESHPTDLRSFLKWWERKSRDASISSPEGTDAVQVMTVHKSKGLEFDCVIVPFADWEFDDKIDPKKLEWRWVEPELVEAPDGMSLPPYLPVFTSEQMAATSHRNLLDSYFAELRMDRLNAAYVAFTRASKELYIFTKRPKDTKKDVIGRTATLIEQFVTQTLSSGPEAGDFRRLHPESLDTHITDRGMVVTVGEPVAPGHGKEPDGNVELLSRYDGSVPPAGMMRQRLGDLPVVSEIEEGEEDTELEDLDPRSEGNLKHAVLQYVRTAADLPEAVRRIQAAGYLSQAQADEILESLAMAIGTGQPARWFAEGLKIINERPIIGGGGVTTRPDRIVVNPATGRAEVVDYKFGRERHDARYRRQIGGYVNRLRRTGRYSSVSGYIWYVNLNTIVLV